MADLPIKAYQTSAHGVVSIVFSTTRGKARHATRMAARDAGYRTEWFDVSAYRAPDYDVRRTWAGNIPVLNKPLNPSDLSKARPHD